MKIVSRGKSNFVIVFKRGESYPDILISFLEGEKIRGSFFFGLGGLIDPEIAYYDVKKKKYLNRKFKGVFEVARLTGNSSILRGQIVTHTHAVLGDKKYKAFAGHLNKAKIGATLEIILFKTAALTRKNDRKTGLNLLK
jgi:predicted DNA-binding protein with PD1-like motif